MRPALLQHPRGMRSAGCFLSCAATCVPCYFQTFPHCISRLVAAHAPRWGQLAPCSREIKQLLLRIEARLQAIHTAY